MSATATTYQKIFLQKQLISFARFSTFPFQNLPNDIAYFCLHFQWLPLLHKGIIFVGGLIRHGAEEYAEALYLSKREGTLDDKGVSFCG